MVMMMVSVVVQRTHNLFDDVRPVVISPSIEFHVVAAIEIKNSAAHRLTPYGHAFT